MSIDTVRRKFRWGEDASQALHLAGHAIATLFAAKSGFYDRSKDAGIQLDACQGGDLQTLIGEACDALSSRYYNTRHPRSLAHMVPPPAIASVLGDLIKGASNQCAFTWRQGPLVPDVEAEVIKWMTRALGLPRNSAGLFTSGGTISNYIATYLALARARGLHDSERLCVITSDQAHFSIQKAALLTGIGHRGLFFAPTESNGRISPGSLMRTVDRALGQGYRPFLLICTAGTTNAGVLEPIEPYESIARHFDAWLHIDGAHGAFSALGSDNGRHTDYWQRADSVSWDPHKTLFVSYPAGALIVRDSSRLTALECRPGYAFHEFPRMDPAFCHLEGSRGFDALKVWLTIRHIGEDGFRTITDYLLDLACHFAKRIQRNDNLELITHPDTNIVCFRYHNAALASGELNALNAAIVDRLYLEGDFLLSRTSIAECTVLRAVLQNPFTTKEDIDRLVLETTRVAELIICGRPAVPAQATQAELRLA